jgi:hypothetical protein
MIRGRSAEALRLCAFSGTVKKAFPGAELCGRLGAYNHDPSDHLDSDADCCQCAAGD